LLRYGLHPFSGHGSAQLYGGYEEGGYHPAFMPESLWKAGASANGTVHWARTSLQGSFSFEQMEGKNVFTSMFLEPGYFPVDILELTPGPKTRQTYRLEASSLTDISDGWAVGIKAGYMADNYSKRKDIRYTSSGMKLRLEPTVSLILGDVGLSLAYIFSLRNESIEADRQGSATAQSYNVFLDKGMRYGTYLTWGGGGVDAFPVREYTNGFAYMMKHTKVELGMELLWKQGRVGEKGFDWFRYPGRSLSLFMTRIFSGGHRLGFSMDLHEDYLQEAALEQKASEGVTTLPVYRYSPVSDRTWSSMDLSYDHRFSSHFLKSLKAALHLGLLGEESYPVAPYTNRNDRYIASLALISAWVFGPVDMMLRLNGGMGRWEETGLQGGAPDAESAPLRLTPDWMRKMEYLSTTKAGGGLTLKYRFKAVKGLYIQADGTYLHGFGVELLPGANRWSLTSRVGYNF